MKKRIYFFFFFFALINNLLFSKTLLKLKNGDIISGKIISIDKNKIEILNTYLGKVKLLLSSIKEGTIDESVLFMNEKFKKLKIENGKILTNTKKKRDKFSLNFGYTGTSATVSSKDTFLKYKFEREIRETEKIQFGGYIIYKESGDKLANQETINEFIYSRRISKKLDFLSSTTVEYNKVQQILYRGNYEFALGIHFIDGKKLNLNVNAGFGVLNEILKHDQKNISSIFGSCENLSAQVGNFLNIIQKLKFIQHMEERGNFLINFELDLKTPLTKNLSLLFGIINRYNNKPQPGVSKNEFTTITGLNLEF